MRGPRPFIRTPGTLTRVVAAGGLAVLGLLGLAGPAAASPEDNTVTGYDLTIEVQPDGVARVALDLTMDFGTSPDRGPYLTYPVSQRFDDDHDRAYRFRDIEVSSETAEDRVATETANGWLEVRIGHPDRRDVTGEHTYRITYTVDGWVSSAAAFDLPRDELFLNVLTDWDLDVQDVTVTVLGPQAPVDGACWAGPATAEAACDVATEADGAARFGHGLVPAGDALTIAVAYPAGTFPEVEPILVERWTVGKAFALTPATGVVTALVAGVGIGLVVRRIRRQGRDEQYLGLSPGLHPAPGQEVAVGPARRRPVAVQFAPPEGLRAGELGTLVDETADPHDVTATIIDLAVRGYLVIELTDPPDDRGKGGDWRLIRTDQQAEDLVGYEQTLLGELFTDRQDVLLSDLRTTFSSSMATVQGELYEEVTARGWFRGNPKKARATWAGQASALLGGGLLLTALLAIWTSWALVGLAVTLTGLVMLLATGSAPARTASGTALLTQTLGFRQYLETAEAAQLRFEEGQDLFSRYLPFAVAFGLTERWAKVFADLAAQGHRMPEPTWYVSHYGSAGFWAGAAVMGRDLTAFSHVTDLAIAAPTPGSSGSSGFSGGGFAGGGVGGGGGGSW